jgi:hypothetical protein
MLTHTRKIATSILALSAILISMIAMAGLPASAHMSGESSNRFTPGAAQDAAVASTPAAADVIAAIETDEGTLRFDVAEDGTRFFFAEQPVHDDGMPAYGNPFVTQGYIYPEGTLDGGNGVLADGSPEFPDKVLGKWTCRGWFIGDGAHTTTGEWVITTQVFDFGGDILVTEGAELADVGVPAKRAITGGTGQFATATGQGEQTLLGFNASEGVDLRFELEPIES